MKTEINEQGHVTVSTGESTWQCNSPEQAAKHIATWADGMRDGRPSPVITPGDASAILDCHNDAQKQIAQTGRYRATKSWRYVNGEAIQIRGELEAEAKKIEAEIKQEAVTLWRRVRDFFRL